MDCLPLTKYNEQYYVTKNNNSNNSFNYYVLDYDKKIIGICKLGISLEYTGICIDIIPEYQNKGIGKVTLEFIIKDIFKNYDTERIIYISTNEASRKIALNNGFILNKRNVLELKAKDYIKKMEENIESSYSKK